MHKSVETVMDPKAIGKNIGKKFKNFLEVNRERVLMSGTVVLVAAVGTAYLIASHAATASTSVEPENGSLSSTAQVVNDSGASGGKAVKFSSSAPCTDCTCDNSCPTGGGGGGGYTIKGLPIYPGGQSYWFKTIRNAPLDPNSDKYVADWAQVSSNDGIHIAGSTTGGVGQYAMATCYGTANDPLWTLNLTARGGGSFKMHCAPNSGNTLMVSPGDEELVFFDLAQKRMIKIGDASSTSNLCNNSTHVCTAAQWAGRDLGESGPLAGLDKQYNPTCDLCQGHRGMDATFFGLLFDDVKNKNIPHPVKITLPSEANSGTQWSFPFVGTEGRKTGMIPEGSRVRLKQASYDRLKTQTSNPYIRAILDELYNYGAITADSGGSGINLKVENGAGVDWSTLGINKDSLQFVKNTDFEFIQKDWGKP